MKRPFLTAMALLSLGFTFAQAPQKMSYQAVIRNSGDVLVTNTTLSMQLSVLRGSPSGTLLYSETLTPTTNNNGLVSVEFGGGIGFDTINWAIGPFFLKSETDPAGGTTYTISGTSELLSVPYALHAKTAESVTGSITETDPVFLSSPAFGIASGDINSWNTAYSWGNHASAGYLTSEVDGSVTNELQALSISHDTIFLSNGGFVKLPAGFDGQYSSLSGAPTNVSAFTNDAGYLTSETDGSVTNELQTISRTGLTVTLSNGGGSYTDSVNVYSAGSGINISANTISQSGHYVGELFGGGIVFYVYDFGQHGLITSLDNLSTGLAWGTSGVDVPNCESPENGQANTASIVAQFGVGTTYAAGLCDAYTGGGYTDWYLPSIWELNLLYNSGYIINYELNNDGDATTNGLTMSVYWSSTEQNATSAWNGYFVYGNSGGGFTKTTLNIVRAVRSF